MNIYTCRYGKDTTNWHEFEVDANTLSEAIVKSLEVVEKAPEAYEHLEVRYSRPVECR